MAGDDLKKHIAVTDILVQVDVYFQVQVYYFHLNGWLMILIFSTFLRIDATFTLFDVPLVF